METKRVAFEVVKEVIPLKKKETRKKRLKPISFYPLKPEKALSLFMQVDPGKIKLARRKASKIALSSA